MQTDPRVLPIAGMRLHLDLRKLGPPLGIAALFLVALAVYRPHLTDFFAADDFVFLQSANRHDFLDYVGRAFSFPEATPFDLETPLWRPLVDLYFYLWWQLFGFDPFPYHLANVLLHGAVAALAAGLIRQLTGSWLTGLLAALLFVVLPTYDYAVTWISDITELLAAFWYLLALVLYVAFLRGGRWAGWLYGGALAAMACALLTKQSAATLLAIQAGLVLAVRPPRTPRALRRRLLELLPFAAVTVLYIAVISTQEYARFSAIGWYRIGWHAPRNLWQYLEWLTFPFLPESSPVRRSPFAWPAVLRTATAAGFLAFGFIALARRQAVPGLLFLWTVVALAPHITATRPIDFRYTYLPAIPFAALVAILLRAGADRLERRCGRPGLVLAALSVLCLTVFLGMQARGRQTWVRYQAEAYELLFRQAPALCGELPAGSRVYLQVDPQMHDFLGGFTSMALNLLYDDALVERGDPGDLTSATGLTAAACTLRYDHGRYTHLPAD